MIYNTNQIQIVAFKNIKLLIIEMIINNKIKNQLIMMIQINNINKRLK